MELYQGVLTKSGGEVLSVKIKLTFYNLELQTDNEKIIWNTDLLEMHVVDGQTKIVHIDGSVVVCNEIGFSEKVIEFQPKTKLNVTDSYQFGTPPFGRIAAAFIGLLVAGFAFYWWGIPAIGNWLGNNLPVGVEKKIGQQMFDQLKHQWKIDEERTKLIQDFFEKMTIESPYNFRVLVVKDEIVNAFAMPGGYIIVYDGLLKKIKTHEELAGLLAHEGSHVRYRHTSRTLCTTLANYLFISALVGDFSGIVAILAQNADQIKSLSYSRELETEADIKGLELLYFHQINPQGMLNLMITLKEAGGGSGESLPEFASTHPLPDSRIMYMEEYLKKHPFTPAKNSEFENLFAKIKYN